MKERMARGALNPGFMAIALGIAIFLWVVAQGSASIEQTFDVPVIFTGTSENIVITDQNADVINIRVMGRRSALRTLNPDNLRYELDLTDVNAGVSDFEVDPGKIELPRRVRIVSRSPSRIEVKLERRWTQTVNLRADIEGKPADGFEIGKVTLKPTRVRITGARGEVRRLSELVTDTIDVTGATENVTQDVRVPINARTVWLVEDTPVQAHVEIRSIEPEVVPEEPPADGQVVEGAEATVGKGAGKKGTGGEKSARDAKDAAKAGEGTNDG